jgi:hypothetical protein
MSKISGPSWSSSRSLERQKKFVAFQKRTLCRFEIHPSISKLIDHVMYLLHMLLQMILPAKSVTTSSGTAIETTLERFDPSMTRPVVSLKLILSAIRMSASNHVANEGGWPSRVLDIDPKEDGKDLHSTSSSL